MSEAATFGDPDTAVAPPTLVTWSTGDHAWLVSRYDDIQSLLRGRGTVSADPAEYLARVGQRTGRDHAHLAAVLAGNPLFQNGDTHRRSRDAVRGFIAARMAHWTAETLRHAARDIVSRIDAPACVDAVSAFGTALTDIVVADMLDVSADLVRRLRACSREVSTVWRLVPSLSEYARLDAICVEAHAALSAAGWHNPGPRAAADLVFHLIIAAGDTTEHAIVAALDLLARHPEYQAELRDEPGKTVGFVREALRLAGPIRRLSRQVAGAALQVGGVAIAAGDALVLDIERANRDPAVFPDPDRCDPSRKGPPPLAFGGGAHACQGAMLGSAQTEAMVQSILERFHLRPHQARGQLIPHPNLRRYASLPLLLEPAPIR